MREINPDRSFTAEDIARYLRKEMSASEMHALERAALEDPFLADAIEGFDHAASSTPAVAISEDLDELKQRLEERITESKKITPTIRNYWWRIAAAVLLVAGVSTLTYLLMNIAPENQRQIAKNESPAVITTDSVVDDRSQPASGISTGNVREQESPTKRNTATPQAQPQASQEDKTTALNSVIVNSDNKATLEKSEPVHPSGKAETPPAALEGSVAGVEVKPERNVAIPSATSRQADINQQQTRERAQEVTPFAVNKFLGQVVDVENNPIAGASVVVENKKIGVSTDEEGKFNVLMQDSAIRVNVASVGYQSTSAIIRTNFTDNRIVLKPNDAAINDVVVVGYGKKKRRNVAVSNPAKEVTSEPAGGWDAYKTYLQKSKRANTTDTAVHGPVVISFLVSRNGKPTNLKVEQSLNNSLDTQAIRLVSDGPLWKPVKGNKRALVTVTF